MKHSIKICSIFHGRLAATFDVLQKSSPIAVDTTELVATMNGVRQSSELFI